MFNLAQSLFVSVQLLRQKNEANKERNNTSVSETIFGRCDHVLLWQPLQWIRCSTVPILFHQAIGTFLVCPCGCSSAPSFHPSIIHCSTIQKSRHSPAVRNQHEMEPLFLLGIIKLLIHSARSIPPVGGDHVRADAHFVLVVLVVVRALSKEGGEGILA